MYATPSILSNARKEQAQLVGIGADSFSRYNSYPYLDQCMKETVRLYALYLLFRKVMKSFQLYNYNIPVGAYFCLSPIAVHHDPKYFPNPHTYDPDHFSPEQMAANNNFHMKYIQWGYGVHRCMGEKFANMVIKTTLCSLLMNYNIEVLQPIPQPDFSKSLGMCGPLGLFQGRVSVK